MLPVILSARRARRISKSETLRFAVAGLPAVELRAEQIYKIRDMADFPERLGDNVARIM